MAHELKQRVIEFDSQVALPIIYDGVKLDAGLRLDLLVGKQVIVELKSVDRPNPLFEAQLLTYLKLANLRLGLLINFNVKFLKDGIQRIVL
jgi:GxxExxY protein